jgi:hypothetical protein
MHELRFSIRSVVYAEVGVPAQQNAFAANLVTKKPCGLIIRSRRAATRVTHHRDKRFRAKSYLNPSAGDGVDPIRGLREAVADLGLWCEACE